MRGKIRVNLLKPWNRKNIKGLEVLTNPPGDGNSSTFLFRRGEGALRPPSPEKKEEDLAIHLLDVLPISMAQEGQHFPSLRSQENIFIPFPETLTPLIG